VDQPASTPQTFFSCNGYTSNAVDCIHFNLIATYPVLSMQWNANAGGVGTAMINLPNNVWFHACITYSTSSTALTLYLNAEYATHVNLFHTAGTTASPVLAGEPDSGTAPTVGSFNSWRIYSRTLSASDVMAVYLNDAPSGYSPVAPSSSTGYAGRPIPPSTGPATIPSGVTWHVVVTAGQSNAVGTNSDTTGYQVWDTTQMIQMYCWTVLIGCTPGTFAPAVVPLYGETNVGFAQTFANLLLPTLSPNHGIVLLNAGAGGTGFVTGQWSTSNTGDTAQLISAAQALVTNLPSQLGGTYVLEAILWHQGENDAGETNPSAHDSYCTYLKTYLSPFIDLLRASLPGASSTTPFIDAGLLPYWVSITPNASPVEQAIYAVNTSRLHTATADSNIFPVTCNGGPCGDLIDRDGNGVVIHFNASQAVAMGYQFYAAYGKAKQLTQLVSSATTAACPSGGGGPVPLSSFFTAAASSSSQLVRVSLIGDSIGYGLYSSNLNPTSTSSTSWTGLLRTALQAQYGDGGSGFISITWWLQVWGVSSYNSNVFPLTFSSGWTPQNFQYLGNGYDSINTFTATTTTQFATATFTVRGSTIEVFYVTCSTCGVFAVTVDGNVLNSGINTASGTIASTSRTFTGLSATTHTVVINKADASSSTTIVLQGVDGRNPTGIILDGYVVPGQTFGTFAASHNAIATAGISQRTASLLILELGVNDAFLSGFSPYYSETPASIQAAITTLTSAFTAANVPIVYVYAAYGNVPDGLGNYTLIPAMISSLVATFVNSFQSDTNSDGATAASNGYLGCSNDPGVCGYVANGINPGWGCPDGVHPGNRGHSQLFNDLASVLGLATMTLPSC
jgi:lysophospholipase L1-like esterase